MTVKNKENDPCICKSAKYGKINLPGVKVILYRTKQSIEDTDCDYIGMVESKNF